MPASGASALTTALNEGVFEIIDLNLGGLFSKDISAANYTLLLTITGGLSIAIAGL